MSDYVLYINEIYLFFNFICHIFVLRKIRNYVRTTNL